MKRCRWDIVHPERVDEVVVDRILSGRDPGQAPTPAEQAAAARALFARGETRNQVCVRLGTRLDRLDLLLAAYPERGAW